MLPSPPPARKEEFGQGHPAPRKGAAAPLTPASGEHYIALLIRVPIGFSLLATFGGSHSLCEAPAALSSHPRAKEPYQERIRNRGIRRRSARHRAGWTCGARVAERRGRACRSPSCAGAYQE